MEHLFILPAGIDEINRIDFILYIGFGYYLNSNVQIIQLMLYFH
jgi:hypothetical protein